MVCLYFYKYVTLLDKKLPIFAFLFPSIATFPLLRTRVYFTVTIDNNSNSNILAATRAPDFRQ